VNRKGFGFENGLFEQELVDFWRERERSMQAAVWGQERVMRERCVLEVVWWFKAFTMNLEAAHTLGVVGSTCFLS